MENQYANHIHRPVQRIRLLNFRANLVKPISRQLIKAQAKWSTRRAEEKTQKIK